MASNELMDDLVGDLDLDLLAELWDEEDNEAEASGTIPRSEAQQGPLSTQQKRLWLLQQIDPSSNAYDVIRAYHSASPLHLSQLQSALNALVDCHDIFRTVYQFDGTAQQTVCEPTPVSLTEFTPSTELTAETLWQDPEIKQWAATPFTLSTSPLLRAAWVNAGEGGFLILRNHHIVSDGWSKTLILKDLLSAYYGQPLTKPRCRYLDYAMWQADYLSGETADTVLSYWRDYLPYLPKSLELPTYSTALSSQQAISQSYQLTRSDNELLRTFCQQHEATPAAVFMTLLQATLSRFSATSEFLIGTPTAARNLPELEDVVGCFMNTQLCKNEVKAGVTFTQAVEYNQRHTLQLLNYDQVPFEWLAEQLNWPTEVARHPHFQVLYNYQQSQTQNTESTGPGLTPLIIDNHEAKFELSFDVSVVDGVTELYLEAEEAMYDKSMLARLMQGLRELMTACLSAPDQVISEHALAVAAPPLIGEQDTLNHDGVLSLISAYADVKAQVAIEDANGTVIDYASLIAQAEQFARFLIEQGVRPEDRIAVMLARRANLMVVLLGVLKAGATYVPIDPNMPRVRQQHIFEASRASGVVINSDDIQPETTLPVWSLDQANATSTSSPSTLPPIHPHQLAYILFTSGSTGTPKGVAISHQNLLNFILAMQQQFALTARDRWLAMTALGFDISGLELYLPLCSGAQVRVCESALAVSAAQLEGVTHIQATPAGWQSLLSQSVLTAPVIGLCGGEALPEALAKTLAQHQVTLFNMYGPTETTIWSSLQQVSDEIHLGSPILNTQLYVLDSSLNPCPTNVVGELYIGGLGLARGYSERPDLTAQQFIANPFKEDGSRLYRSGDLVRVDEHAKIHFLGRADHQVKIRGHRIELGDIESQLLKVSGITQAVVVAKGEAGAQSLVAYVCGEQLEEAQIKASLGAALPSYMVPGQVIVLATLPLTHSGKVDRRALPDSGEIARVGTEPSDAVELALAKLWQQVLKVEQVYREDNFFALGGTSIHALRLVYLWQQQGRPEHLAAQAIWQAADLASLASDISATKQQSVNPILPEKSMSESATDLLICVHDGRGFVMSYRPLADALSERIHCVGVTPDEALSTQDDFHVLAARYAEQLGDVSQFERVHVLGWSLGGAIALQLTSVLQSRGISVTSTTLIDSWDPFEPALQVKDSWRDFIFSRLSESIVKAGQEQELKTAVAQFNWSDGSTEQGRIQDIEHFLSENLQLMSEEVAAMPFSEVVKTLEQTYRLRVASRKPVRYHLEASVEYQALWSEERSEAAAQHFCQQLGLAHQAHLDTDHMRIISDLRVKNYVQTRLNPV